MALFDEAFWWKMQLRRYTHPFNMQPPMVLPKVNSLTGHYKHVGPYIHDEMNFRYSQYSKSYWEGVRVRQKQYLASLSS